MMEYVDPEIRTVAPPRAGVCRRCLGPVDDAAHVVLADSNVVHLACYVPTTDAVHTAARFLEGCEDRRICHTCLSGALRLRFEDARRATSVLRLSPRFRVEIAPCAMCRSERVTVRAVPAAIGLPVPVAMVRDYRARSA